MSLTYGTDGIKQKDWDVYIAAYDTENLADTIDAFILTPSPGKLDDLTNNKTGIMQRLGELRADSIVLTSENGDSIEGNIAGDISLNKNCSFTCELINCTPENITALSALDHVIVTVVLQENVVGAKTVIVIPNAMMSYSENITGGDTTKAIINLGKTPKNVSGFRKILQCTA